MGTFDNMNSAIADFFNTPAVPIILKWGGRVVVPKLARLLGKLPRGFKSMKQFMDACRRFRGASGVDDAVIGIRGSAVSGRSATTGQSFGPGKDLDFFVISDKLHAQGVAKGAFSKQDALNVGATMDFPALHQVELDLTAELGRKATIRIVSQEGFENVIADETAKTFSEYIIP